MQSLVNRERRRLFFSVSAAMAWSFSVTAMALNQEQLQSRLDKAEAAFDRKAASIVREAQSGFKRVQAQAKLAGNLDLLQKLERQLKAFKENHRLPEDLDTTLYRQQMTLALDACLNEYNRVIASVLAEDPDLAELLQSKRDQFDARFSREFPGARIKRIHWKHPNGVFKNIGDDDWHEELPGKRYAFKETGRDAEYVYLFDQSRNSRVILSVKTCAVVEKNGKTKVLYEGKWID